MAGVDAEAAAVERGYPLTDREVMHLDYVGTEGGGWKLRISVWICKALCEEKQPKSNA